MNKAPNLCVTQGKQLVYCTAARTLSLRLSLALALARGRLLEEELEAAIGERHHVSHAGAQEALRGVREARRCRFGAHLHPRRAQPNRPAHHG